MPELPGITDLLAPIGMQGQGLVAIPLSASQIASPTAAILANVTATFYLNVSPFTRYQSNGTALVSIGGGGSFTGGTLTSALNNAPAITLASAATVAIGAAAANTINISGAIAITAFDTIAAGATRRLIFGGIPTLTHNATSLILPGAANITTAAGDVAEMESLGGGNWKCVDYVRASGAALVGSTPNAPVVLTAATTLAKLTHANCRLDCNSATPFTVTIDGTTAYTTDDGNRLVQDGAGAITLAASGVTFSNPYSLSLVTTGVGTWIDFEWNATIAKYVITAVGGAVGGGASNSKRYVGYTASIVNVTDFAAQSIPAGTVIGAGSRIVIEAFVRRTGTATANISVQPTLAGSGVGATSILLTTSFQGKFRWTIDFISTTQALIESTSSGPQPVNNANGYTYAITSAISYAVASAQTIGFFPALSGGDTASVNWMVTVENAG